MRGASSYRRIRIPRAISLLAAALAITFTSALASADVLSIIAGPSYNPATGTGYTSGSIYFAPGSGVNDTGTAIGYASYYASSANVGSRAVRWDAAGSALHLNVLNADADGVTYSFAYAVNEANVVVGYVTKYVSNVSVGSRAVRWDAAGVVTELGNLGTDAGGYTSAIAHALNESGVAVGFACKYVSGQNMGSRAVRWDAAGTASELGHLGTNATGVAHASAVAINASGVAAGSSSKYLSNVFQGDRAVRWDTTGAILELGNLGADASGYTSSHAYALNDSNAVAGYAVKYVANVFQGERAVRWDAAGAALELNNLGTNAAGVTDVVAYALNASNITAGRASKYVSNAYKGQRAVRWNVAGVALELDHLGTAAGGVTNSAAYALNASNVAAGYVDKYVANVYQGTRAVYWTHAGRVVDLTELSGSGNWTLRYARAISDSGYVAGYGSYDPDGTGPQAAYQRLFTLDIRAHFVNDTNASNDWSAGGNWAGGIAPASDTDANFVADGAYAVSFSTDAIARDMRVARGDVTLILGARRMTLASLSLQTGGKASLSPSGSGLIVTSALSIDSQSTLDLKDNHLIVGASPGQELLVRDAVQQAIALARAGNWSGPGLTSSLADSVHTLGTLLNDRGGNVPLYSTYRGQSVNADATLVSYTWAGDLNLDGFVNIDDYFAIDVGYARGLAGYWNGDINYSGSVTADDYYLIDAAFHAAGGQSAYASVLPAPAPVPEPRMLILLSIGVALLGTRRGTPTSMRK